MRVEVLRPRNVADRTQFVRRADAGAAGDRDDAGRYVPRRAIPGDRLSQRIDIEAVSRAARRQLDQVLLPDPGNPGRAIDRAVNLVRAIDPDPALAGQTVPVAGEAGRTLTHRQNRRQRGRRRAVLDHAGIARRQRQGLPQPVDHDPLEFGGRWRCLPKHALRGDGRDQHLGQHRRRRGVGREIGEEARMLPMGNAWHHDALEVRHDGFHRFPAFGRRHGKRSGDLSRPRLRPHRMVAQAPVILGGPVGHVPAPLGEFVPVHPGSSWTAEIPPPRYYECSGCSARARAWREPHAAG